MCNRTSNTVSLAIAYYSGDNDFFVSQGWWNLNPGGCATVFPNNSYDSHRYYYAETKGKATTRTSDNGPDVGIDPQNRFMLAHADSMSQCPSPDVRQRFHFFGDNDLNLTAGDAPIYVDVASIRGSVVRVHPTSGHQEPERGRLVHGTGCFGALLNSANTTWTFHEEMTGGTHDVGACSGTMLFTIHD